MPTQSAALGRLAPRLRAAAPVAWSPWAWVLAAGFAALLVLAPLASLAVEALRGSSGLWPHLLAYVLPQAVLDTVLLLAGVGLVVGGGRGRGGMARRRLRVPRAGGCWTGRCSCRWRCRPTSSPYAYLDCCTRSGRSRAGCGRSSATPGRATSCCRTCARCRLHPAARLRALPLRLPAGAGAVPDAVGEPDRGRPQPRARPAAVFRRSPCRSPAPPWRSAPASPCSRRSTTSGRRNFLGVRTPHGLDLRHLGHNAVGPAGRGRHRPGDARPRAGPDLVERAARRRRHYAGAAQRSRRMSRTRLSGLPTYLASSSASRRWRSVSCCRRATSRSRPSSASAAPASARDRQRDAGHPRLCRRAALLATGLGLVWRPVPFSPWAARRWRDALLRLRHPRYAVPRRDPGDRA